MDPSNAVLTAAASLVHIPRTALPVHGPTRTTASPYHDRDLVRLMKDQMSAVAFRQDEVTLLKSATPAFTAAVEALVQPSLLKTHLADKLANQQCLQQLQQSDRSDTIQCYFFPLNISKLLLLQLDRKLNKTEKAKCKLFPRPWTFSFKFVTFFYWTKKRKLYSSKFIGSYLS